MRPADLFLYLVGNRAAIERIAGDRRAWLIGAILVITAGIARNYDHLDLLREPEAYIGPFVASLISTIFIFWWANLLLRFRRLGHGPLQLVTFLSLFWLTAPCAWLYAVPVEAWTDLVTATKWNVAFLAIVSVWRVALITRAVAILTGASWLRCLGAILAPASLEMMVGSYFQSLSLVGIMGGVRLPPHDAFLLEATQFTTMASFVLFVTVTLVTPFIESKRRATSPLLRPRVEMAGQVWILTLVILVAWMVAVIPMQRKVGNQHHLATLFRANQYQEAIRFASGLAPNDFPPARILPPDPYRNRFDFDFYTQIPNSVPHWLKQEWHQNAVTALKEWIVAPEHWKELKSLRPDLVSELRAHAEQIRAKSIRNDRESWWLERFDRLEREAEELDEGAKKP